MEVWISERECALDRVSGMTCGVCIGELHVALRLDGQDVRSRKTSVEECFRRPLFVTSRQPVQTALLFSSL